MKDKNNSNLDVGMGIHARRTLAYIVLAIISFFCLFWFYVLFINATRSNSNLQSGFSAVPSTNLIANLKHLFEGRLPVMNGLINSLIVSSLSAVLSVYFSTMTAYAIHAYDFKLKKFIYPFILAVMMIPSIIHANWRHVSRRINFHSARRRNEAMRWHRRLTTTQQMEI